MDYFIFCSSVVVVVALLCIFCFLSKITNEGISQLWKEKDTRGLERILSMSYSIMVLSLTILVVSCLIVRVVWFDAEQNLIRRLGLYGYIFFIFLLFVLFVQAYFIRKKILKIYHSLCENNIVTAQIKKNKNGLWIYQFFWDNEEHLGYFDRKPSADVIKVIVLKYDNKKKMYLLQEVR